MKELKNILVATDFSKGSYNALAYAIEMAKICDAKVSLLHAYRLIPASSQREDDHLFKQKLESEIQLQFKAVCRDQGHETENSNRIRCIAQIGFAEDVIASYIHTEPVDLVVMGTSGISNSNKAFGSTFSAVATCTDLPILAIPQTVSFKKWNRILLTKENKKTSKMIPYLINKFDSEFDMNNLSNTDFGNFVSDSTVIGSNDLLSIQPDEYTLLEKQISQHKGFGHTEKLVIPLLIA